MSAPDSASCRFGGLAAKTECAPDDAWPEHANRLAFAGSTAPQTETLDIVADQPVDGVKEARVHFYEVDGSEIRDGRLSLCEGAPGRIRKPEAAIDNREFLSRGLPQCGDRGYRP